MVLKSNLSINFAQFQLFIAKFTGQVNFFNYCIDLKYDTIVNSVLDVRAASPENITLKKESTIAREGLIAF